MSAEPAIIQETNLVSSPSVSSVGKMISVMRPWAAILALCLPGGLARAQAAPPEPKSVTVPLTIDHNRIVIDVEVLLSNGTTQQVHAWVDNGNPDLEMSKRLEIGRAHV